MSKFSAAADALKRLAVKYEGLLEAAKELDELGSLNGLAEGYKAEITILAKKRDVTLGELNELIEKIANQRSIFEKEAREAKNKTEAFHQEVLERATKAEHDAIEKIDRITQDKNSEMNSVLARYNLQVKALTEHKVELESQIETAKSTVSSINTDIDSASERLASIRAAISKLAAS